MLFLLGKLISAGAPEMFGVLVREDRIRINMSEWVREGAVCTSYQKLAELAKFQLLSYDNRDEIYSTSAAKVELILCKWQM